MSDDATKCPHCGAGREGPQQFGCGTSHCGGKTLARSPACYEREIAWLRAGLAWNAAGITNVIRTAAVLLEIPPELSYREFLKHPKIYAAIRYQEALCAMFAQWLEEGPRAGVPAELAREFVREKWAPPLNVLAEEGKGG